MTATPPAGQRGAPRPETRSVALAIRHPHRPGQLLVVRRPHDDPDLPDAWGLPAASLLPGERWEDAARRAARDKLGLDILLGPEINRGSTRRAAGMLSMRLFDASFTIGEPHVPQAIAGVTQYTAWRWATPHALVPAARVGSLCCRLQLEAAGLAD